MAPEDTTSYFASPDTNPDPNSCLIPALHSAYPGDCLNSSRSGLPCP